MEEGCKIEVRRISLLSGSNHVFLMKKVGGCVVRTQQQLYVIVCLFYLTCVHPKVILHAHAMCSFKIAYMSVVIKLFMQTVRMIP